MQTPETIDMLGMIAVNVKTVSNVNFVFGHFSLLEIYISGILTKLIA